MRSYHPTAGFLLILAVIPAGFLLAQTPEQSVATLQVRGEDAGTSAGEAFISDAGPQAPALRPEPLSWMGVRQVQFDAEIPSPVEAPPTPMFEKPALTVPEVAFNVASEVAAEVPAAPQVAPAAEPTHEAPPVPAEPIVEVEPKVEVSGLTLLELEEMALATNPTLVQARMSIQAAQGRRLQAGLLKNPNIGYIADEIGNESAAGIHGMSLSQEFITANKRQIGQSVAGHAVEEARWSLEVQRYRVMNDIRIGYVDVALTQQTIDINREFVRIGQENVNRTQAGVEVKQIAEIDLLQARNEAENANLALGEAQGNHRSAWNRLAIAIGRPGMPPERLAFQLDIQTILGSVPDLDSDACLARLLTESPEIAQAQAAQERAQCEWVRQRAERTPNFELSTAVKYDDATGDTMADFGVSLPLQLFDRNQGRIMEARADLMRAQKEVQRVEMDLSTRLTTAFDQYANARRRVEAYDATILPNSQSLFEKTENAFKRQQIDYYQVMLAQRTHFRNRLNYLVSVRELLARRVEIEGLLLTGGLQAGS